MQILGHSNILWHRINGIELCYHFLDVTDLVTLDGIDGNSSMVEHWSYMPEVVVSPPVGLRGLGNREPSGIRRCPADGMHRAHKSCSVPYFSSCAKCTRSIDVVPLGGISLYILRYYGNLI